MQYNPIQYGKPNSRYVGHYISYILDRPDLTKSISKFIDLQIGNYQGIVDLQKIMNWIDDRSLAFRSNETPVKYFMNSFKYNLKKGEFDKLYIEDFPIHDFIKYLIDEKSYRYTFENYTELYILLDHIDCFINEKYQINPQTKLKEFLDKVISFLPSYNSKFLTLTIFIEHIKKSKFLKEIGFGKDELDKAKEDYENILTKWSASGVSFFYQYFKGE